MKNEIMLSHKKDVRILTTILLLFVIFLTLLLIKQLLSSTKFRYIDLFALASCLLLITCFIHYFFDSWEIIKVNEKGIEKKLFFYYSILFSWNDIIRIEESKTNIFKNFVQGRTVVLITKQGKKIVISKKIHNYDLFCKLFSDNLKMLS